MKTPYDTALRALQREVEDLRVSIGTTMGRLTHIEQRRQAANETIAVETSLAAGNKSFSPEAFLARVRADRDRLATEQRAVEAHLETLREQAMERYGSLRAMEEAVNTFRAEAERAAATREQAGIDDFSGARFVRAMRHARRAPGLQRSSR